MATRISFKLREKEQAIHQFFSRAGYDTAEVAKAALVEYYNTVIASIRTRQQQQQPAAAGEAGNGEHRNTVESSIETETLPADTLEDTVTPPLPSDTPPGGDGP